MRNEDKERPKIVRLRINSTIEPTIVESASHCLGRAIIYQALLDLSKGNKEAASWFFVDNKDFITICELADVEPKVVRFRAWEVKNNPSLVGNDYAK
jgi:hypothetical protein